MTEADRPLIRPLSAADRRAIAFSFARLGERSRYQRFLAPVRELTPAQLELMAHVDHWHHEGLIAYSPVPRSPIGLTEYVRLDAFDEAELAVAVVDAWQRRGIGSALATALRERALAAGVRRFNATVFAGNAGALALARKLGRPYVVGRYRDLAELRIELSPERLEPSSRRSGHGVEIGGQAVIPGHHLNRSPGRGLGHAERVAGALDDQRRDRHLVKLGRPSLLRASRRVDREGQAEHAHRLGLGGSAAGDPCA